MRRSIILFCFAAIVNALVFLPDRIDAATQQVAAGQRFEASLYGHVESFEWKEFDDDGAQLLKESGPLAGMGALLDLNAKMGFHVQGKGEFFFGRVDYDGATWGGDPVDSKTKYGGFLMEANVMAPLKVIPNVDLQPCAGGGGRIWQRQLEDSEEARGYNENWLTIYGILGMGVAIKAGAVLEFFGQAAAKIPVYNRVNYDFSDSGGPDDVEVEPGKKMSPYFEAGIKARNVTVAGFYEEMKFSKSDAASIGPKITGWQPDSEAKIFGLRAGLVF